MGTWKRRERESEGVQTIYYSRGGGNQSGDCESAKLDPLLPRSREPFIKDVRTWTGRGLQNYLILRTINYTTSTRLQTGGIGCQKT